MRLFYAILICVLLLPLLSVAQKRKTENVILVTLDGFRWQELFNGADSGLMNQQEHLKDPHIKEKYFRTNAIDSREALLPFLWNTIGTQGQIFGNRSYKNFVNVTNKQWFSYPGYNEILTGSADDRRINSNDKVYNPNVTVLEFLNSQNSLRGKIAAFTSWDVFPYIINDKRSGVFVSTGIKPVEGKELSEKELVLNEIINAIPNPLNDVRLDAFTFHYGMEYMRKNKPRVMYFAFDETDDFAHAGEYAAYLNSANYTDRFLSQLWGYVQSEPFYKNKTTLIITVDHGRGVTKENWKHHGIKVPNADEIWYAIIGPDTPANGEMKTEQQQYQKEIASIVAGILGYQFPAGVQAGSN